MNGQRQVTNSIINRLIISVLWVLSKLSVTTQEDFGRECEYGGDMCDISLENCIAKMEDEGVLGECRGILYGPGMLYDTREDTPFWIRIKDKDVHLYPTNLTYTITTMPGYEEFGSLSSVSDCCSLKLSDRCVLPKKQSPSERQTIYLPLANGSPYCSFKLLESTGVLEYCEDENDKGCLEFRDGILHRRNAFLPSSTQDYSPPAEYCFFPTPNEYVITNGSIAENEIIPHVTNISYTGSGNNITARMGNEEVECDIVKVKGHKSPVAFSANHHDGVSDFVCFFLRVPSISANWATNPSCVKIITQGDDNVNSRWWMTRLIVSTIGLITVIFVIAFVMILVYKNYIKKCTSKNNIKELPDNLARKTTDGEKFIDLQKDGNGSCEHPAKEIPDEITFEGLKEDKKALKPKEENLLHGKEKTKTGNRYSAKDSEGSIDPPISPGHQDSGFHSDKDVQNEEEELYKAGNEEETSDANLNMKFMSANDRSQSDDENMNSDGITYDGYTNKATFSASLREKDASDHLVKHKEQSLQRSSSSKHDSSDGYSSKSGLGGSRGNFPGYITQVSHQHRHSLPEPSSSLDGYVSK